MKKLIAIVALLSVFAGAFAQLSYRIGTIFGNGSPQGYHVGSVDIGDINDRLDFEFVTMTPWEFGSINVGPGVEWFIPRSQNWRIDMTLGLSLVTRVDGPAQPLKNFRVAISGGITFEENPETGEIYLIFHEALGDAA
jgi:hypothetical protein